MKDLWKMQHGRLHRSYGRWDRRFVIASWENKVGDDGAKYESEALEKSTRIIQSCKRHVADHFHHQIDGGHFFFWPSARPPPPTLGSGSMSHYPLDQDQIWAPWEFWISQTQLSWHLRYRIRYMHGSLFGMISNISQHRRFQALLDFASGQCLVSGGHGTTHTNTISKLGCADGNAKHCNLSCSL